MDSRYDFANIEKKWTKEWKANGLFNPFDLSNLSNVDTIRGTPFYTVFLPIPGSKETWQIGQMLAATLVDIIVRRKKMQGFNILVTKGIREDYSGDSLFSRLGMISTGDNLPSLDRTSLQAIIKQLFVHLFQKGLVYFLPGDGFRCPSCLEIWTNKETVRCRNCNTEPGPLRLYRWYLKTRVLAMAAVHTIQTTRPTPGIGFFPAQWANIFLSWAEQTGDYCISRSFPSPAMQVEQVPAYHCPGCFQVMVSENLPSSCANCGSLGITADPGHLDVRFASALLSAAFLAKKGKVLPGIPGLAQEYNIPHSLDFPFTLMAPGTDGLFIRLTLLITLGKIFDMDIPFREVLLTGNVKEKKNNDRVISSTLKPDYEYLADTFGADVSRLALARHGFPGRDISLTDNHIKSCQSFINKTWNACRFVLKHLQGDEDDCINLKSLTDTEKWLLHGLDITIEKMNDQMDNYRVNEAAKLLYQFFRYQFCHWYLEFSRISLHNRETRQFLKFSLSQLLELLHPFIPFITEELYQILNKNKQPLLSLIKFPSFKGEWVFSREYTDIEILKKVVRETRKIREENHINPSQWLHVFLISESKKEIAAMKKNMDYFNALVHSNDTRIVNDFSQLPRGFKGNCLNWDILLPINNDNDRLKELERLKNELETITGQIFTIEKKLDNPRYIKHTSKRLLSGLKRTLQAKIDQQNKIHKAILDLSCDPGGSS